MWLTFVLILMALAIVALAVFAYTLLLQINSIKLTQDVSRLAFRDRCESLEESTLEISKALFNISSDLIDLAKIHSNRLDSIEFLQGLHSQQIKCIEVIMWD